MTGAALCHAPSPPPLSNAKVPSVEMWSVKGAPACAGQPEARVFLVLLTRDCCRSLVPSALVDCTWKMPFSSANGEKFRLT